MKLLLKGGRESTGCSRAGTMGMDALIPQGAGNMWIPQSPSAAGWTSCRLPPRGATFYRAFGPGASPRGVAGSFGLA